jgi:hypothetical protein
MQNDDVDDRRELPREDPDRRKNLRRRCVLSGYVFFPNDDHVLPVRVGNLSEVGAKLQLAGLRPLPDKFTLLVAQRRVALDCIVVWKNLPNLGVHFVGEPNPDMQLRIDAALKTLS